MGCNLYSTNPYEYDNMLDKKYTRDELNDFAKKVIRRAQGNKLSEVAQSLEYDVDVSANSFRLEFKALPYADFLDQGVRGKESSSKAPRSPYRFGSGNFKGTGDQFERNIAAWIRKKRLRLRDQETGKFIKGGKKTLNFLIRRSIYKTGLRPTLFFTNAFNDYFPTLPDELIEAYGLDAERLIETTFRDHLKQ